MRFSQIGIRNVMKQRNATRAIGVLMSAVAIVGLPAMPATAHVSNAPGESYCGYNYGGAWQTDIRVHGPKVYSTHAGGEYVRYKVRLYVEYGREYQYYGESGWTGWKWATPSTPADFSSFKWTSWEAGASGNVFVVRYLIQHSGGNQEVNSWVHSRTSGSQWGVCVTL